MNAVELTAVCAKYQGARNYCIHDLNLSIPSGQVVLLSGESGCGKTTITRIINGLFPRYFEGEISGTVKIIGQDSNTLTFYDRAKIMGSVFQDPRSQFYTTTTTDEVAFGCENLAIGTAAVRQRTDMLFCEKLLMPLKDRSIFNISSGEKQKIAIASIRAMQPDIFVFDEPSANLDMIAIKELTDIIGTLKAQGKTVVISEHRLYYLMDLIDRMVIIKDGSIIDDVTAGRWLHLPLATIQHAALRCFALENLTVTTNSPATTHDSGTSDLNDTGTNHTQATIPLIQLKNLSIGYGKKTLLQNINFQGFAEEVIGIVGQNGIGKTSFARTLCGLAKPLSGEILLSGRLANQSQRRRLSSFVMQDPDYQLFSESVLDELQVGQKVTIQTTLEAKDILEDLGLSDQADTHPMALSGGQKQRLTIGACIAKNSQVIFMDEPTSGLDGKNMNRLSKIIAEQSGQGKLIFTISHDYEFLAQTCTRIIGFTKSGAVNDFKLTPATLPKLMNILTGGDL